MKLLPFLDRVRSHTIWYEFFACFFLMRDDRRWLGDAVISSSASGLNLKGTCRETLLRLASESRMLNDGTFDSIALLTRSSKAKKPMNACVHTYTKSQTPSTRRRGPGWRIHGSVEDTKLSTNKQHSLNKLSTSCIRLDTCSSSEELSIVMLFFGRYGVVIEVSEFGLSLSRATLEIVAVLHFSSHCKNCNQSLELSLCWKGHSSIL
jgi:hypothetical protein